MGTLGTRIYNFFQTGQDTNDNPGNRAYAVEDCSLRALPMEDIWLHRKPVDNSRVVRAVNPDDNLTSLKALGSAAVGMALLIGLLLPSAYNLMAGYRIHQLQQEKTGLVTEKAALETERARLLSPSELAKAAKQQDFHAAPDRVVLLNPNLDSSFAMNVKVGK